MSLIREVFYCQYSYLTQFGCELEALLICHAGEQESVDGHSLLDILLSLQREQLLLTAGLLEAVVHWIHREGDEQGEGEKRRGGRF